MRFQILGLILFLMFSAACGDGDPPGMPPPPPVAVDAEAGVTDGGDATLPDGSLDAAMDAERPDAGVDATVPEGGPLDASLDASLGDASVDAGSMDSSVEAGFPDADGASDAFVGMDGSAPDGGIEGDASADAMDEWTIPMDDAGFTEGHRCYRLDPGVPCGAGGSCAAGYRCTDSLCGDMRCLPAGRPCAAEDDCPAASECRTIGAPPDEARVCWRASGCADSRDCQMGFSCESGMCVDRRIPCQLPPASCPIGMVCIDHDFGTGAFCARVAHVCRETALCPVAGSVCLNVTGGTRFQCGLTGMCMTSADCSARRVCGTDPDGYYGACMDHGPCAFASQCPVGMACQDLAGDGLSECVLAGGTCAQDSDCPVRQVCATTESGLPPSCTTRAF